jgi:hypothetical protein
MTGMCLKIWLALFAFAAASSESAAFAEPSTAAAESASSPVSTMRFRGGIGGFFAVGVPGRGFFAGGIQGRLGVQFNDLIALYAEPELLGGGGGGGVLGLVGVSPLVELTVKDRYYLGAGPCVMYGVYAANTGNVEPGIVPGAKLKLGVGFGGRSSSTREQFTIGADARVLQSLETGWGALFGLSFGYDAK